MLCSELWMLDRNYQLIYKVPFGPIYTIAEAMFGPICCPLPRSAQMDLGRTSDVVEISGTQEGAHGVLLPNAAGW